jgi:Spy/CpxP family protein refolding chaperone
MLTKRSELGLLWLQPNPDRDKINAAQKEMSALRDKMQDEMTSYRLDMLKVLTPEQQARFQAFAARRGHGPGFGGECRGGGSSEGMKGHGSCDGPHRGR